MRLLPSVDGGSPVNFGRLRRVAGPNKSATAEWLAGSIMSNTCFKRFTADNLYYKDMRVQQLFFAVV